MISVVLAEDHETVREGLRLLVDEQADMEVVAAVGDGAGAVEQARRLKPDVIILDLTMPGMSGLAAARELRTAVPSTAVIALTRHNDPALVKELLAAGAMGYVLKQSSPTELLKAIRVAIAGNQYIDAALRERDFATTRRPRSATLKVTDREREVLRRMALGHSNKDIASALHISVRTVEVHKTNAMHRLGLRDRADLVRYAVLNGWLQDP